MSRSAVFYCGSPQQVQVDKLTRRFVGALFHKSSSVAQTLRRHQEESRVGKSSEKHGRADICTAINRLPFSTTCLKKKGPAYGKNLALTATTH
jgi:hypothetical protein